MAHQGSQGYSKGARTLPRLDMASLQATLPSAAGAGYGSSAAGSGAGSYSALSRPRPSFSSSAGAPLSSSSSSNAQPDLSSAFSPWSPTGPAVPSKSSGSGMMEQYNSWDNTQRAPAELQQQPPPSSSSRPLPTPPPVTSPNTAAGKRPNPLEDLILTETLYVADLGAVIKRVAGAWSRSNFPPPSLDAMFRAVEAVYRVNKALLAKLNEIGPNPASPKVLGDLLMQWPIDLSPAYSRYSTTYQVDFDDFDAVQSNPKLGSILAGLDWPATLAPPSSPSPPTLDHFFLLPLVRLGYYKKLYAKLLKSTQEGRSDHVLLVNANAQIDGLIARCEEAKSRSVVLENGGTLPLSPSFRLEQPALPVKEEVTPEPAAAPVVDPQVGVAVAGPRSNERSSGESARVEDSSSSSLRSSGATGTTNNTSAATHLASSYTAPPRIEDLERRLSTDRVLDIFTMLPKACKLQMAPPNLPFTRQIRRSADVSISFTPLSDPSQREVIISNAHIFLLTDLFLVCQRMTPEERLHSGDADMWLLYPPLAGKHLRVVDGPRKGELEITIMRKEKLVVRTEDASAAREWRNAFDQAVEFGAQQPSNRSNSTSSRGPNSPISPPPASASLNGRGGPSPSYDPPRSAGFSNGYATTPEPISPRYDSPQEMDPRAGRGSFGNGLPSARNQQFGGDRRAFSAGPAPPPPRGASMYGQTGFQSTTSLASAPSPLPHSPAHGDFGRGASPNGQSYSLNGSTNGRYSPYGQQSNGLPPSSDFGGMAPTQSYGTHPGRQQPQHYQQPQYEYAPPVMSGARPQRTNSGRSNGSYASGRTDRSSAYPEPPPLPGKAGTWDRLGSTSAPGSNESYGPAGGRGTGASSRTGSGLLSPGSSMYRSQSAEGLRDGGHQYRMPSAALQEDRSNSAPGSSYGGGRAGRVDDDDSPPPSPLGKHPEQTVVVAQMRSKIFLRQNLGQWKSLGTGKLKLFLSQPSNAKQLVVDSDKGNPPKTVISTIVLTDGVERVGKTGVAVELSDNGSRTGIVYMLQLKTEQAATGLFDQLLLGSDRKRVTR